MGASAFVGTLAALALVASLQYVQAATNHPGPNYIVGQQAFVQPQSQQYRVVGGQPKSGSRSELQDLGNVAGRLWVFSSAEEIIADPDSTLCLDVSARKFVAGNKVIFWKCHGEHRPALAISRPSQHYIDYHSRWFADRCGVTVAKTEAEG